VVTSCAMLAAVGKTLPLLSKPLPVVPYALPS
jgi:hypothetical protein